MAVPREACGSRGRGRSVRESRGCASPSRNRRDTHADRARVPGCVLRRRVAQVHDARGALCARGVRSRPRPTFVGERQQPRGAGACRITRTGGGRIRGSEAAAKRCHGGSSALDRRPARRARTGARTACSRRAGFRRRAPRCHGVASRPRRGQSGSEGGCKRPHSELDLGGFLRPAHGLFRHGFVRGQHPFADCAGAATRPRDRGQARPGRQGASRRCRSRPHRYGRVPGTDNGRPPLAGTHRAISNRRRGCGRAANGCSHGELSVESSQPDDSLRGPPRRGRCAAKASGSSA